MFLSGKSWQWSPRYVRRERRRENSAAMVQNRCSRVSCVRSPQSVRCCLATQAHRCPCMGGEPCNNKTRQCLCKFCSRRKKERKIFSFSPEALRSKNTFQLYLRSRTVTLGSFGGFSCLKFSRNAAEISEFFWFHRLGRKSECRAANNLWINAIVVAPRKSVAIATECGGKKCRGFARVEKCKEIKSRWAIKACHLVFV